MSIVNVAAGQIETVNSDQSSVLLRVYARRTFIDSLGVTVQEGILDSEDFFLELTCTVDDDGVIHYPSFQLRATQNASSNPRLSSYTLALYEIGETSNFGIVRKHLLVPDTTPTTLENLAIYNDSFNNDEQTRSYYTADQIDDLFDGLDVAPDASDVVKGKGYTDVPPESSSAPIFVGSNSPLLEVNGINLRLPQYGLDTEAADNTAALQAVIDDLPVGGGTIVFPNDFPLEFTGQLDLTNRVGVILRGTNTSRSHESTKNLIYTGGGSDPFINLGSAHGCALQGLNISYTNPLYTGWLVKTGHAPTADAQQILIEDCAIGGTVTAKNAVGLVDLNFSINGAIRNCHFQYAEKGIRGREGTGGYAYGYKLESIDFNNVGTHFWNPDTWITENTIHNPVDLTGIVKAFDSDGLGYARGLVVLNAFTSDATASDGAQLDFVKCLGLFVSGCWLGVGASGSGIRVAGCQGFNITANRFEPVAGGPTTAVELDGVDAPNIGGFIGPNDCNVDNHVAGTGNNSSVLEIGNLIGGSPTANKISGGLHVIPSPGTDTLGGNVGEITFGRVTGENTTGQGAAIRVSDSISGLENGALVYNSRSVDVEAQHSFRNLVGEVCRMNRVSNFFKGADVASAATIIPTGNSFHVTGTTGITGVSVSGVGDGAIITLIFDGVLTVTDGSNLKLNGNYTTSADDTLTLRKDGANYYEMGRSAN